MADKPWCIAHRGASHEAPENTVPALVAACEQKADLVAIEVQPTSDGHAVLLADTRLERTTNGSGRLSRTSLEELRRLDAGSWFSAAFSGTRAPTLEEALAALTGETGAILLTREVPEGSRFESELRAPIESACRSRRLIFASEDAAAIARRQWHEAMPCCLLMGEKVNGWLLLEKALRVGARLVRVFRRQADGALLGEAHRRGLEVLVHFADEELHFRELADLGADGIFTHRPAAMRAAFRKAGS